MNLTYTLVPSWPPLAWLAHCKLGTNEVIVMHGKNVEVADDWFCEAVWDGEFDQGGFDNTDIVSGSGGRRREGKICFVSAGNTVDRLVSIQLAETTFISNSLPCLAFAADLDFLLDCDWYAVFHSIVKGIEHYQAEIPSSRENVLLTYFHNLVWNGQALSKVAKPIVQRNFSSFERYYEFLVDTLKHVQINGCDNKRQFPFKLLTTVSTGYDSPTVSAIAKAVEPGIEGFTFSKNFGSSGDDGSEIARYLKINLSSFDADEWKNQKLSEVPHIAADCLGEEVQYNSAEPILDGRILLTGFHGDVIWGKEATDSSGQVVRGDPSGLSLTEYRLWKNFLHCPIPFWGATQFTDINRLSNQQALGEWDVSGDYSRPICRRIVENAGVPRELFGRSKKAASSWPYSQSQFLTPQSMKDYLQWLQRHRAQLIPGFLGPVVTSRAVDRVFSKILKSTQQVAWNLCAYGYSIKALDHIRRPLRWFATLDWGKDRPPRVLPLRRYIFPWAVEVAKRRYFTD